MGKSKSIYDLSGVDPMQEVSKHLNKKGQLKGGDKKKTKALRSICVHHAINKKGKQKARIHDAGNGNCQCAICRDKFKADFYTDKEYADGYASFKPQISQAKMMAISVGADKETVRRLCELNLYVDRSQGIMKSLRKVAQKQDAKKNKKKKKTRKNNLGAWKVC